MKIAMNKKLASLVGRNVRLRFSAFQRLAENDGRSGAMENFFVVAAVAGGMSKLICYGANLRIIVSPGDLVLI